MAGKKGGVRGGMSFAQRVKSIGRKKREAEGGGPAARGGRSDVTNPSATASNKEYGGMGASKGTKKSPPFSNLSREYDSLSDGVQRAERNKGTRSRYHKVFSIRDKKSPPPTLKQLKAVKKGGKAPSDAPERVGRGKYVKPDEETKKARKTIAKAKKLTPAQRRKNLDLPVLAKGGFPDLTGDGKVTKADVLKGRGVAMNMGGMKKKMPAYGKGGLKPAKSTYNMGGMKKQYGTTNYMYGGSVMGKKKK